jgi:ubiquitin carboxyl-terminal hydrolase L5
MVSLQALFNVMLRDFGVKGVKIQEVVSLDEEMMTFLK